MDYVSTLLGENAHAASRTQSLPCLSTFRLAQQECARRLCSQYKALIEELRTLHVPGERVPGLVEEPHMAAWHEDSWGSQDIERWGELVADALVVRKSTLNRVHVFAAVSSVVGDASSEI
jgi:hypothetical protein